MDDQNKNLILATVLSFLVILGWFLIFPPPETQPAPQTPAAATEATTTAPAATASTSSEATEPAAAETARISIDTPRVSVSIALTGGRIDDLLLKDYRVTIDP